MSRRQAGASVLLALSLAGSAYAHRLDEYLQATLIGVTRHATEVEIHLTPGVAMLPLWMAVIDQDHDGRISTAEERDYADRVVREVELRLDGAAVPLTLIESDFPTVDAMRQGLGTIRIKLRAPRSGHVLRFENRHLPQVSAYLVNCLAAPSDGLVVSRQVRDEAQKSIEFAYSFATDPVPGRPAPWIAPGPLWAAAIGLLLLARMLVTTYKAKRQKRA